MKFLLVVQLIITLMMIGIILVQKSEGGGLGMGSGPGGGMFTARGASNFLTRLTAILAAIFMGLCLLMTWMNRQSAHHASSIIYQEQPQS